MLRDFIANISVLMASCFLIAAFFRHIDLQAAHQYKTRLLLGFAFGLQGILLMFFSIKVFPTVWVDLRQVTILIAALFGGAVPAIAASVLIAAARFILFGINKLSLISASIMLLTGLSCIAIARIRTSIVYKFMLMNIVSTGIFAVFVMFFAITSQMVYQILAYYIPLSLVGGTLTLLVITFLLRSRETIRKLARSEERYRQLILHSPDATLVLTGGIIRFSNEKGVQLLGAPSKLELNGKPLTDFIYAPSGETLAALQTEGRSDDGSSEPTRRAEQKFKRLDGSVIDVELAATSITYRQEPSVLVTARDITSRKKMERKLKDALSALERLSELDGLTGIANRRKFDTVLEQQWQKMKDSADRLSLILFDVDSFKAYNDEFGHQSGDDCLRLIASTADGLLSGSDRLFARYGGEEFAVILPETGRETAAAIAENLRRKIEGLRIPHPHSKTGPYVTISLGVAAVMADSIQSVKELILMADRSLYQAKDAGRNRVSVHH
jgi:diguanylate cyclase (GGDEF)-like protein/PAS domain S-box-containing protein